MYILCRFSCSFSFIQLNDNDFQKGKKKRSSSPFIRLSFPFLVFLFFFRRFKNGSAARRFKTCRVDRFAATPDNQDLGWFWRWWWWLMIDDWWRDYDLETGRHGTALHCCNLLYLVSLVSSPPRPVRASIVRACGEQFKSVLSLLTVLDTSSLYQCTNIACTWIKTSLLSLYTNTDTGQSSQKPGRTIPARFLSLWVLLLRVYVRECKM